MAPPDVVEEPLVDDPFAAVDVGVLREEAFLRTDEALIPAVDERPHIFQIKTDGLDMTGKGSCPESDIWGLPESDIRRSH